MPLSDTDKEKLDLEGCADLAGGESDMGPSAALTPAIWDKTIPYDGESFHLEYMDLEEFLMENGIPTSPDSATLKGEPEVSVAATEKVKSKPVTLLPITELDRCEEEVVIITKSDLDITCDVSTGEWGNLRRKQGIAFFGKSRQCLPSMVVVQITIQKFWK